jgi:hypothetical protein
MNDIAMSQRLVTSCAEILLERTSQPSPSMTPVQLSFGDAQGTALADAVCATRSLPTKFSVAAYIPYVI